MIRPHARRFLPPLSSLLAFEAAARHASFSKAAAELHLTQGAVSRQIRALEQLLDVVLFERISQRVVLTTAGVAYAGEVRPILDRLRNATLNTMTFRGLGGTLDLAILPTFGTRWLIPRLPAFFQARPDITINFATRIRPFDFAAEPLDAAIHFGDPTWPGAVAERLMGEELVPVCCPRLAEALKLRAPSDFLKATLLQQATRPRAWADWFEAQGVDPGNALQGPRFEQFAMVAQAAAAGLGAAILPRFLIGDELSQGRLVIPIDRPVRNHQAYYLVYPEAKSHRPPLRAFRDWLLATARDDEGRRSS